MTSNTLRVYSSDERPVRELRERLAAAALPEHVREKARTLLSIGSGIGLKKANIFPGEGGSVAVAFYANNDCVEAIVGEDGTIEVHVERGQGFQFAKLDYKEDVTIRDVFDRLRQLVTGGQWNLRESSNPGTLIETEGGSPTSPLSHLREGVATHQTARADYPSSTPPVPVGA